jgi:UPF0288 family protein (methanogenesis marker protein 3)
MGIVVEDLPNVVGMTIPDAEIVLKPFGVERIRAKTRDGKPMMVTQDMQSNRLNVSTINDLIASVGGIG